MIRKSFLGLSIFSLCATTSLYAQSMQVNITQQQIPVLKNKGMNRLLALQCIPNETISLEGIKLAFDGTTKRSDIAKIYLVREGKENQVLAESVVNKSSLYIPVTTQLSDTTQLALYCDLKPETSLLHFVDVQCKEIKTDKGVIRPADETIKGQRVAVAVQDAGTENVAAFRIPGLATTKDGSLIAVYDARRESSRDLQGHMDIGVSRSTDKGQTWEPMRVALDMKTWGGLPEKFNGVSDACVLTDPNTGTIWVAGLWMHGILDKDGKWIEGLNEESKNWQHQWVGRGSQPGLAPKETCQFLISRSDDDGKTWSEPMNITEQTKRPEWWLYAPAPGQGIVMKDGTLVFPTQGRDTQGMPFSNITYSKDGGKTWTTSNPSYTNTTECAVVELNDGSLMLNMRDNRNGAEKGEKNGRAVFVTNDLGNTWTEHASSHGALNEPVCMASLHKHEYGKGKNAKSVLLFSNPDSKYHRHQITIKVSTDEGKSWKKGVLLDEGYGWGYSCITSVSDDLIGILYESSRAHMTYQLIPLKEILY